MPLTVKTIAKLKEPGRYRDNGSGNVKGCTYRSPARKTAVGYCALIWTAGSAGWD